MENNLKKNLLLVFSALALLTLARLYVPALSLIAVAPIFAILADSLKGNTKVIFWGLVAALVFTASSLLTFKEEHLTPIYGVGLSLSISLFLITQTLSKNRLGFFTIVIFWLGFDYLMLKIMPLSANFFMSTFFEGSTLASWSRNTGNLGITGWIIVSNILFYYALFAEKGILDGNVRWLTLTYAIVITSIPILIGMFITNELTPITTFEVLEVYYHTSNVDRGYAENGEWLGRTSAWVATLMIIYSFVKQKIK